AGRVRRRRPAAAVACGRGWRRIAGTGPEHGSRASDLLVADLRLRAPARPSARGLVELLGGVPPAGHARVWAIRPDRLQASRLWLLTHPSGRVAAHREAPCAMGFSGLFVGLFDSSPTRFVFAREKPTRTT